MHAIVAADHCVVHGADVVSAIHARGNLAPLMQSPVLHVLSHNALIAFHDYELIQLYFYISA
jgi:hypothetical protein